MIREVHSSTPDIMVPHLSRSTESYTMTAAACACWARQTFSVKLQPSRLMRATFPRKEEEGEEEEEEGKRRSEQASSGSTTTS